MATAPSTPAAIPPVVHYRKFVILGAIIAVVVGSLYLWKDTWDSPGTRNTEIGQYKLRVGDQALDLTVTCKCPPYLVQSKSRWVTLEIESKRSNVDEKVAPKWPSVVIYITSSPEAANFGKTNYVTPDGKIGAPTTILIRPFAGTQELLGGMKRSISVNVTPNASGSSLVTFEFGLSDSPYGQILSKIDGTVDWQPEVRQPFARAVAPYLAAGVAFFVLISGFFGVKRYLREIQQRTDRELEALRNRNPNDFAWESARIKLQSYFDKNLLQVGLVFWFAVLVMAAGFLVVLRGVNLAIDSGSSGGTLDAPKLSVLSGLVTQFIGATFLVIYRSTMSQAEKFMGILERINTVGMAVSELNKMDQPGDLTLKSQTRAQLIALLAGAAVAPRKPADEPPASDAKAQAAGSLGK